MRAVQDGPQRPNVASVKFIAPQLGLKTVIDLASIVEPEGETEAVKTVDKCSSDIDQAID